MPVSPKSGWFGPTVCPSQSVGGGNSYPEHSYHQDASHMLKNGAEGVMGEKDDATHHPL